MVRSNHPRRDPIMLCLIGTALVLNPASALRFRPALLQPGFATSRGFTAVTTRTRGVNGIDAQPAGDAIVGFGPLIRGSSQRSRQYKATWRLHCKALHAHGDEERMPGAGGSSRQSQSISQSSNARRWGVARSAGTRRRARCWSFKSWSTAATRATASAKFDLGRDEANAGFGNDRNDQDGQPPVVGSALVAEGSVSGVTSSSKGASSLDRFLQLMAADDTKKLGAWTVFALVLSRLRFFYGVMLGTFVLSYMGNTVIEVSMDKGNRALRRMGERMGWRRLPKKFPRPVYAAVYILLLLTAITSLSVVIVPRLTVESQALITKLSEQDNPYAIIASWMRGNFGEEALSRLEPFLLSVTGDQGRIFAGYPDDYLNLIASKLKDKTAWGDVRNARFAKLLQFSLGRYFKGGLNMCRAVVAGLTKVLYKAMVSLLFSFMVIWDLPNLSRGMKALKTSRLGFAYNTISPQVSTFAKLVGQSFEVQFTIAAINTLLTTAGLIALGVSGPLVLSFIVFLCSFVPVIGVFISTLPMAVAALADYGMSKVLQILLMVFGVHAVEAYFLNPQIYASKLKLHPVVVIGVLYMAEHLVGVQGLIMAVPCAVFVINNIILGNNSKNSSGAAAAARSV